MFNFRIKPGALISDQFLERNITHFDEAHAYIKQLAYKRNSDKNDPLCVFRDQCGTCGTKHATLKMLADENGIEDVKLMLVIFRMNKINTPAIKDILTLYHLPYIPEAHNYLLIQGEMLDCTFPGNTSLDFKTEMMEEIPIKASDITSFKVAYHQQFIRTWLQDHHEINYSMEELFSIRELCIARLSEPVK